MIVTLREVLSDAKATNQAVAGLVCLGWEDMRAYVKAAELEKQPVIIQAGPSCRKHTPLSVLGPMMRYLAEQASVPVVVHLDHGTDIEECRQAIKAGFSSVMYDGSRLSLQENIETTRSVVELAKEFQSRVKLALLDTLMAKHLPPQILRKRQNLQERQRLTQWLFLWAMSISRSTLILSLTNE